MVCACMHACQRERVCVGLCASKNVQGFTSDQARGMMLLLQHLIILLGRPQLPKKLFLYTY